MIRGVLYFSNFLQKNTTSNASGTNLFNFRLLYKCDNCQYYVDKTPSRPNL